MESASRPILFRWANALGLALLLAVGPQPAAAQAADGRRDPDFRPVFRSAAKIDFASPQADGRLIVGGDFDRFLGQPRRTLAMLRTDATLDPVFAPSLRRNVIAAVRQSDGRVVCAERTSNYGTFLFRLAADGSPDPSFVGPGLIFFQLSPRVLELTSGDRLIVARQEELGREGIIRLLPDGRMDPSFSSSTSASAGSISGARVRSDGSVVVWGNFTSYGGAPARGLVRLRPDGAVDPAFTARQDAALRLDSVELAADGGVLLCAAIPSATDEQQDLVRLAATGEVAATFPAVDGGDAYAVAWVERQGGTRLVLVPRFNRPSAPTVFQVIELRVDGSAERTFRYALPFNHEVSCLGFASDGATYFADQSRLGSRLLRLPPGAADAQVIGDPPGELGTTTIDGLAAAPDGRLLTWGSFFMVDGVSTPNGAVVRRADGTWDTGATVGLDGWGGTISDGVAVGTGWLVVGTFTDPAGSAVPFLRLDAAGNVDPTWLATARSLALTRVVAAVADGGGALVLGLSESPNFAAKVLRVRLDGSLEPNFNADITSEAPSANALVVRADGKFYVGHRNAGYNTIYGSSALLRRLPDGRPDPSFTPAANTTLHVSFVPRADGGVSLLTSAESIFGPSEFPGYSRIGFRRLREEGSVDATIHPRARFDGQPIRATALRDGRILVDGGFYSFGERARAGLARMTADGELDANFRPEVPVGALTFVENPSSPVVGLFPVPGVTGATWIAEMLDGSLIIAPRAGPDPLVRLVVDGRPAVAGRGRGQLANVSSRGRVEAGDRAMIGGFVVNGGTRRVIVRALGPSLAAAGVPGTLGNPTLDVFSSAGSLMGSSDDWATGSSASAIIAAGLAPTDAREAALALTLAPGAYTAVVRGAGGSVGVALVEVYVLDAPTYDSAPPASGAPRAANLSTRAFVGTSDGVLIGGFAIRGGSARVALRGLGPTLAGAGVPGTLADPYVAVVRQTDGYGFFASDSWALSGGIGDIRPLVLPTPTTAEVATVLDLPEGDYTVIVSGADSGTGIGMFEVYELPDNGAP